MTVGYYDSKPEAQPIAPEKSLRDITADQLHQYFMSMRCTDDDCQIRLARLKQILPVDICRIVGTVGSISDNRLGGWYGYRMAKASLYGH